MQIPKSWVEVTIAQYQAMTSVMAKQLPNIEQRIELATIFMGKEADHLTVPDLIKETDKLNFMASLPSEKMAYSFELNGRKFAVNVITQTLTAGQYIDLTALTKNPEDTIRNLHNIMAVIATDGEYKGYIRNAELFRQKLTMDKVYPASAFFLKVGQGLMKAIEVYLKKENRKNMKEIKRLEKELSTDTGVGL